MPSGYAVTNFTSCAHCTPLTSIHRMVSGTYVCRCEICLEYTGTVDDNWDSKSEAVFGYRLSYVFHRREYQISVGC